MPGRKSRNKAAKYDNRCYKCRNRIEVMFGPSQRPKERRSRYGRCQMNFFSAIGPLRSLTVPAAGLCLTGRANC